MRLWEEPPTLRRQLRQARLQVFQAGDAAEDFAEGDEGGGDVLEEVSAFLDVAEEAVSAEGLHEALHGAEALDGFLRWTEYPLVKLAETGLVLLLAAHMTGGVRLLMLEFLAWRDWQMNLLAIAAGASLAAGLAFALNVV